MENYVSAIKNYAVFTGRTSRQGYWMFVLFNILFSVGAVILDQIFGTAIEGMFYGLFYILYSLAIFLPGIAVTVRRLHDIGKSGGFIFISLIPFIGGIWLLILLCKQGDSGINQYGESR